MSRPRKQYMIEAETKFSWCSVPGYDDTGGRPSPRRRSLPGYKCYSQADLVRALELVHEGTTSMEAGKATRVPDSSIRRLLRKCTAHTGPCRGARHRPGTRWHSPRFDAPSGWVDSIITPGNPSHPGTQ